MRKPSSIAIVILLVFILDAAFASGQNINIYIWGDYLPISVIKQFTKETGIQINLTEYDNNETMFAKLKTSMRSGYDVVVPSGYYVERMAKRDMLLELDKKRLTNLGNLNPKLLNRAFDPENRYSVPYLWGSIGIIYNAKYLPKDTINSWQNFWNPKYKNQLMMLNDMRDVFTVALLSLGYSANEKNPKRINEAYLKLRKLLPNVKIFNIDTVPNIYIDEDAIIGMAWSGDYRLAREENSSLRYVLPKEGYCLWIDSFVILKNAPNVENAYKFINFMLRPEIAALVTNSIGHSTANLEASKFLAKNKKNLPWIHLDNEALKHGNVQLDFDAATRGIYEKYWEKLKMGK